MKTVSLGDIFDKISNGINCKQTKDNDGQKITRIETISKGSIDLNRVGFCKLDDTARKKYKMEVGDILFSHINSPIHVGKTAVFNGESELYHGINLLLIRTSKVEPQYLEYFFKLLMQTGYWVRASKQAVNQASVNQQDIKKIPFSYPEDHAEQRRIVKKLDEAFAAIDKAEQNTEKNFQNSQELFESELTTTFCQLAEEKESLPIGEVCEIIGGGTPSKSIPKYYEGTIPWATVRDMNVNTITSTQFNITEEAVHNSSTNVIPASNIVIATRVGLGKVCKLAQDTAINQDLRAILPKNNNLLADYLFWYFKSIARLIEEAGIGATVKGVKLPFIKGVKLPVLSKEEQINLVEKFEELSDQTQRLQKLYRNKLAALEELRQSILKQAFEGKL